MSCNVSARNVSVEIEGKSILRDISFELRSQRVGIVGRNGSGKSTLSRTLAGLLPVTEGELSVRGIEPFKDRKGAVREIGVLFQNPDRQIIFPTVIEEVAFGLKQIKEPDPEAKAREWLEKFGRLSWENAHCANLSQGQKHLLCLISVLAMGPSLVILDEPFAGLDIPTKAQLNRHLEAFDGSLIHISHDPRDLAGYEECLWIEQGELRMQGAHDPVMAAYEAEMQAIGARDDIADLSD